MIVRVEWKDHDRTYTIGIRKFLEALDIDKSEADIKNAVKRILRNGTNG